MQNDGFVASQATQLFPWILADKEHIVFAAIMRLPCSAGLRGNGYRLQPKSPSGASRVTPLFPGKNAVGHFG